MVFDAGQEYDRQLFFPKELDMCGECKDILAKRKRETSGGQQFGNICGLWPDQTVGESRSTAARRTSGIGSVYPYTIASNSWENE